jgi:hypothetical protein
LKPSKAGSFFGERRESVLSSHSLESALRIHNGLQYQVPLSGERGETYVYIDREQLLGPDEGMPASTHRWPACSGALQEMATWRVSRVVQAVEAAASQW